MKTTKSKKSSSRSKDSFEGRSTVSTGKKSGKSAKSKKADTKHMPEKEVSTGKVPREVKLIGLLLLCIAIILSMFDTFGTLGKFIKGLLSSTLGVISIFVPVFMFVIIVHLFLRKSLSPHKHRYVFAALGLLLIGGLFTLGNSTLFKMNDPNFASLCDTHISGGKDFSSGGLSGALLVLPLKSLIGGIGTGFVLTILAFACFVTTTGTAPLTKLCKSIADSISDFAQKIKEERDAEQHKEEEIKAIIKEATEDVPRKKKKKKKRPHPDVSSEEAEAENDIDAEDFKIVLYDNKKDSEEIIPEKKKKKKKRPHPDGEIDITETAAAEIPEEIQKAALEASGGVTEEKEDNSPIAVTDEEIESDYIKYTFPPIELLEENTSSSEGKENPEDLRTQAKKLIDTLASFGVEAKVLEVSKGPSVTRFELQPSVGVKVSKIVNLADDIALNLAAFGVRIEAPIPGKAAVGIEIPNKNTTMVSLREVIDSNEFTSFKSKTAFAMGKDISGQPIVSDISKMPHMLIAGATGSGKSVCINSLITSILYKADPNEVKLILIDPKVVELGVYNGIPHLLIPVVTDPRRAAGALNWAVQEMVKRYSMFATANVRDLKGYNEYASLAGERELEQIIIVIDELADLMMVSPHEVEDSICRLAQMARAAGMHLVIATQRPSVDVITGLIKANVPSRIAFSVSSQIDSRTILDMGGAEKLLGKGDMLFLPMGASKPKRLQGAFVSDKEIEKIVEFVKADSSARYNEDIIEHIENGAEDHQSSDDGDADDLLPQAIGIVVEIGQASASLLQRKLKVGYSRAGRLVDQLEERGIIGPHEGSKPRKVLMSKSEYQEMMLGNADE